MKLKLFSLSAAGLAACSAASSAQLAYDADLSYHDLFVAVDDFGDVNESDYQEVLIPAGSADEVVDFEYSTADGNAAGGVSRLTTSDGPGGFSFARSATAFYSSEDEYFSVGAGGDTQYLFSAAADTPFRLEALLKADDVNGSFSEILFSFENLDTGEMLADYYVSSPDASVDLTGGAALTGVLAAGQQYQLLLQTFAHEGESAGLAGSATSEVNFVAAVPEPAGASLVAVGLALAARRRRR